MRPFHTTRCRKRAFSRRVLLVGRSFTFLALTACMLLAGCCRSPCFQGGYQQGYPYYNMPQGQVIPRHQFLPPGNAAIHSQPNPVTTGTHGATNPGAAKEQLPWDPTKGADPTNTGLGSDKGLVPDYQFDPSDNSARTPGDDRSAFGSGGSTFDGGNSRIESGGTLDPGSRGEFDAAKPRESLDPGNTFDSSTRPGRGTFGAEREPFDTGSGSSSGTLDDLDKALDRDRTPTPEKSPNGTSDIFDELDKRKPKPTNPRDSFKKDAGGDTFEPFKEEGYESGSASFQPPMRINPDDDARPVFNASVASSVQVVAAEEEKPAFELDPTSFDAGRYDYDDVAFKWLQGRVDYDEAEDAWQIMYNVQPDASDPYGGAITLSNDPRLRALRKSDVVLVGGYVDSTAQDSFGKPIYHIEKISVFE